MLSSFGGALFSYSTSAAKPDLGLAPFIFAVTAVLLGGVSLAGGRGSPGGILLGVLSLSLLETLFAMPSAPVYIVNLVQGVLLLLVVVFEAPDLRCASLQPDHGCTRTSSRQELDESRSHTLLPAAHL